MGGTGEYAPKKNNVGKKLHAARGVGEGSALAVKELKLWILEFVQQARSASPNMRINVQVDDIS